MRGQAGGVSGLDSKQLHLDFAASGFEAVADGAGIQLVFFGELVGGFKIAWDFIDLLQRFA